MRIFVIEDELASIESAKIQLGKDHELVFFKTAMEVEDEIAFGHRPKPDLVLTDVNIPIGDVSGWGGGKGYSPNDIIPAGLIVALWAAIRRIPTVVVTDIDGHRDIIGLLLKKATVSDWKGIVWATTVKNWIDTPVGKGKDWLKSIPMGDRGIEKVIHFLTQSKF